MADQDQQFVMEMRLLGESDAAKAIEHVKKSMESLQKKPDSTGFMQEMMNVRKAIGEAAHAVGELLKPALGGFSLSLAGVTLGLVEAMKGMHEFTENMVAMKHGADRVGLSLKQYRGFIDAAKNAAIVQPEAIAMMEHFNDAVNKLKTAQHGPLDEAFRRQGADVVSAIFAIKDPMEQMRLAWERMQYLKGSNPVMAREWSTIFFGSTKALRMTWEEIQESIRHASGVTSRQMEDIRKYSDEWTVAAVKWRNIKQSIGVELLKSLTPIVELITRLTGNKENIELLAEAVKQMFDAIGRITPEQVEELAKSIGDFIRGFAEGVGTLVENLAKLGELADKFAAAGEKQSRIKPQSESAQNWDDVLNQEGSFGWRPTIINLNRSFSAVNDVLKPIISKMGAFFGKVTLIGPAGASELGGALAGAGGGFSGFSGGGSGGGGGGGYNFGTGPRSGSAPESTGSAPSGDPKASGRQDYFQRQGMAPPSRNELSTVKTPFGSVVAHPQAADDVKGFFEDLHKAGAPIQGLGSYNRRMKRFGGGWSSHAYGTAFDIDDKQFLSSGMKAWIDAHPQEWKDAMSKRHMIQYMPQKDPGHIEWTGPGRDIVKQPEAPTPKYSNDPATFDRLRSGAAASTRNKAAHALDISINATEQQKGGMQPLPSMIFSNNPRQSGTNPTTGNSVTK